jgi:hypothetical protein
MIDEEQFEKWKKRNEEEIEHLNAEIFKAESYIKCLRQRKDAAILSSFPGGFRPSMKVENMVVGEWVVKDE